MASTPYFWTEKNAWYVYTRDATGKRKRVRLAKTKREAFTRWKAGLASGQAINENDATFSHVAAKWLAVQVRRCKQGDVSGKWLKRVARTIESFDAKHPSIRCSSITPSIVRDWLGPDASASYEHTEASTLKQVLRWAFKEERIISSSTLESMRLSKGARREVVLSLDDHRALVHAGTVPGIRALLWFCWWTGARPIELRELTWEDINEGCDSAVLHKHKNSKKTGKARVIFFNRNAQAILRSHRKAEGLLFTNSRGNLWTKDTLVGWMRKLRERSGKDGTAYAYRHSYITRMLEKDVSSADIAAITGTSVQMIDRNYGHLDKSQERLKSIVKGS